MRAIFMLQQKKLPEQRRWYVRRIRRKKVKCINLWIVDKGPSADIKKTPDLCN